MEMNWNLLLSMVSALREKFSNIRMRYVHIRVQYRRRDRHLRHLDLGATWRSAIEQMTRVHRSQLYNSNSLEDKHAGTGMCISFIRFMYLTQFFTSPLINS